MDVLRFYPISISYAILNSKFTITIKAVNENGQILELYDDSYTPNFFCKEKEGIEEIRIDKYQVINTKKERGLLRVYVNHPYAILQVKDRIEKLGVNDFYEHDIPSIQKYMIEKKLFLFTLSH
jgi:DNA polymerase elongation subunit (family B)